MLARIDLDDDAIDERIEDLAPRYQRDSDGLDVQVTGFAEVFREVGTTIEEDLVRAETIALPITLLLLVLVFGSVVSASLPLMIGALSVVGTFLVLRVLASLTEVSIFSLNLTTAMGLGLAIDYSLFVVSRFREEMRAGRSSEDAVVRTVRTAGRTVIGSAATVAASLCALLVFPLAFLRSFAYAGVAVAFLAGLFSVVTLPAVLAALGPRVDKLTVFRRSTTTSDHGFWAAMAPHRHAQAVAVRRGRDRRAAPARRTLPGHQARPARRPCPARGGSQPPGVRHRAGGVLVRGGGSSCRWSRWGSETRSAARLRSTSTRPISPTSTV